MSIVSLWRCARCGACYSDADHDETHEFCPDCIDALAEALVLAPDEPRLMQ